MQIFPRLGCLAAQLVRIAVACARLHLAVKKDAKNARGLVRERATTLFPRSRAFYIRLASFIFATSIAFPLSENLVQARIAGEGFSIISTCCFCLVAVICNTARFISLPSIPASQGDGCGQVHSQSPQFSLSYTPC